MPLLLISGALRAGSFNRKLLEEAERLWDGDTIWADIRMPLYDGDLEAREGVPEAAQKLADQMLGATAIAISFPEYNQSFPGALKNALDWVSRTEGAPMESKPLALMSATAGRTGGARAQFAMRLALVQFQPNLIAGPELLVANAAKEFDETGRLTSERYLATLKKLIAKLKDAQSA